jgi:hypothetical protein
MTIASKENLKLSEIFQLMLDNVKYFEGGLCVWVNETIFQKHPYKSWSWIDEQTGNAKKYFREHRPINYYWLTGNGYFWKRSDINPRVKFLKKHIKKLQALGL